MPVASAQPAMPLPVETRVEFRTTDSELAGLYLAAEKTCKENEKIYPGDRPVLIEGGGYNGIWVETQPMGGEMYAKRNMTIAFNNTLFFVEHQLPSGRYPGLIRYRNQNFNPEYTHTQGFSFPYHALNLYYWNKKRDDAYLRQLRDSFEKFDAYLWKYRDSDGDGCLETWSVWDTGEDDSNRFAGTKLNVGGWPGETPPDDPVFPLESMDFMAYSYDARMTNARISVLLGDGREREWEAKAAAVRDKMRSYLWDDKRGACFDRDRNNKPIPTLIHNNLRVMYHGAFTQEMAGRFVNEHMLNPKEFWTPFPLPSVAFNDPVYRAAVNDWGGEPMGLTYQRAIGALENYGFNAELVMIGEKLLAVTKRDKFFPQQYDPVTGAPTMRKGRKDYGPTALAALEYISRFYGINVIFDELHWGALENPGHSTAYTQHWDGDAYSMETKNGKATARINGREIFQTDCGVRIDTDWQGRVLRVINLRPDTTRVRVRAGEKTTEIELKRNGVFEFPGKR